MIVTLSDPLVQVDGWMPDMDSLGEYTLKIRKTPEELKEERKIRRDKYGDAAYRVNPMLYVPQSCITKSESNPSVAYLLPGLWPRVKAHLDARGISYEIIDQRSQAIRPPLDMEAFRGVEFREQQDVAIALIATADCGMIETSTGWGKSHIIALLCKAYPTLNIVVTTSSTQVVNTLYEYLYKVIPGDVGIMRAGKNTVSGKRVIVTTLKSLPNIDPEKVHLLLVDEAHAIGDNQAGRDVMKFCFARRFGFSASPIRNDGSALLLESIIGPTILKMTYQESVDAGMVTPMKYLMLPCRDCPPAARNENLPEFLQKRLSYWCNRARNGVIRDFVKRLKSVYDGQILIVVSTLEHAIQLHMMLPWFKVAYYGSADKEELVKKFPAERYPNLDLSKYKLNAKQLDIMRMAFGKGTLKWVISTKVFKQGKILCPAQR